MATQNWDDHDRSHRYACRDFGRDYLQSCQQEGNPILFCDGDNDTFPLWYCQEVEGVRTDVRVVNLNYLPTDWYIDQQRRPTADAPALPIPWHRDEYHGEGLEWVPLNADVGRQLADFYAQHPDDARRQFGDDPFELSNVLQYWVRSEDPSLRLIPTDKLHMTIDKQAVRESGMVTPDGRRASELADEEIPDRMEISLRGLRGLHRGQLAFLEVLARTNWRRPLYVCVSVPGSEYLNLDDYLVCEGFASRFTPFRHDAETEVFDVDRASDNLTRRFAFGGLDKVGLYLDAPTVQMASRMRMTFAQLAQATLADGRRDGWQRAFELLERCDRELPEVNLPLDAKTGGLQLARAWALLTSMLPALPADGAEPASAIGTAEAALRQHVTEQARRHIAAVGRHSAESVRWIQSLSGAQRALYEDRRRQHEAVVAYMEGLLTSVVEPREAATGPAAPVRETSDSTRPDPSFQSERTIVPQV